MHVEVEEQEVHVASSTDIALHGSQHSEPSLTHVEQNVLAALAMKTLPHVTASPLLSVGSPHVLATQHSEPSSTQAEQDTV